MKIVAMIPARMAATRFPGKPLALIKGLPMIEHVRRRVQMAKILTEVYVATCDEQIKRVVETAGGKVIMTKDCHERCTDRVAEASDKIDADIIINVQGDEPLIMPEMIDAVARPLVQDNELYCVNLATPITDMVEFEDPNAPKLVTDIHGDVLYISREPIPSQKKTRFLEYLKLKQLGIISFRHDFLKVFTNLTPTPLEQVESVDMMRAVEHGYKVRTAVVKGIMIGVDVPDDVGRVENILDNDPLLEKYIKNVKQFH
ncbi:MAG: 3-deoxy-manno-octulosonate cytidylyltransferase [Nitrospirae bacterium]|nr:3-deoxy-manno-octulosonate cytidylyltransferase [Nitrospirota bacterium]MBF0553592.1 3-deoxy-manno-octulosonate cytidylyltransferase [Nitrospirota bacterium]